MCTSELETLIYISQMSGIDSKALTLMALSYLRDQRSQVDDSLAEIFDESLRNIEASLGVSTESADDFKESINGVTSDMKAALK